MWSCDFIAARTDNGRAFLMLNIIGEYTRDCLDIAVERKIASRLVIERLAHLFVTRGIPDRIRSDNGPEFTAKAVRKRLGRLGATTLFIEPGSPWENGCVESFNARLRDGLLDGEIFTTLLDVFEGQEPGSTSHQR